MLYKYKNDYEKIAMGLLSFIPDLKEISHLKSCFEWYRAEDDRHLYLWKNEIRGRRKESFRRINHSNV